MALCLFGEKAFYEGVEGGLVVGVAIVCRSLVLL